MVFALSKADGRLLAFASAVDAASFCSGSDVMNAAWLFFSDDGSPLEARFARPTQQEHTTPFPGAYMLQRAISGLWLQERLDQVRRIEGCGPTSIAELVELLKVNRSKRVVPGGKRG